VRNTAAVPHLPRPQADDGGARLVKLSKMHSKSNSKRAKVYYLGNTAAVPHLPRPQADDGGARLVKH
jgi:hypothetical protein